MISEANKPDSNCRNLIGVWGDNSCPELEKHVHCQNCPVFANTGRELLARQAPEDYLVAWEARAANLSDDGMVDAISVLMFRLSGIQFGLSLSKRYSIRYPLTQYPTACMRAL